MLGYGQQNIARGGDLETGNFQMQQVSPISTGAEVTGHQHQNIPEMAHAGHGTQRAEDGQHVMSGANHDDEIVAAPKVN